MNIPSIYTCKKLDINQLRLNEPRNEVKSKAYRVKSPHAKDCNDMKTTQKLTFDNTNKYDIKRASCVDSLNPVNSKFSHPSSAKTDMMVMLQNFTEKEDVKQTISPSNTKKDIRSEDYRKLDPHDI